MPVDATVRERRARPASAHGLPEGRKGSWQFHGPGVWKSLPVASNARWGTVAGARGAGRSGGGVQAGFDSPKATAGVIHHHRPIDFCVGGVAGNVWCAERHVVQEIPVNGRFPFPYVHDRSSYRPSGQSLEQGSIIHDFSACGIDQNGRCRHAGKFICSDQMKRRIGSVERQGDVKGHEVGAEDFSEWPVSSIAGCCAPMADHAGASACPTRAPWPPRGCRSGRHR